MYSANYNHVKVSVIVKLQEIITEINVCARSNITKNHLKSNGKDKLYNVIAHKRVLEQYGYLQYNASKAE